MKSVLLAVACLCIAVWSRPVYAQQVHALIERGNTAYAKSRFDLAAAAYREALSVDESSVVSRENLGLSLYRLGQIPQALDALAVAAELFRSPTEQAAAHYNLGTVLAAAGRVDEALSAYRRSLRLADRADARRNYTLLLRQKSDNAPKPDVSTSRIDELRRAARQLEVAVVRKTTDDRQTAADR